MGSTAAANATGAQYHIRQAAKLKCKGHSTTPMTQNIYKAHGWYFAVLVMSAFQCFFASDGRAQEIQHFLEYNVQPDYWTFPGPVATDVDAGGDLNLAIPVATILGRGLDYEVVFSYRSGITFAEPSNWIGLGWSFNPGSITREVEAIGQNSWRTNSSHYGVDSFDDPQAPSRAADVFYVTIPGRGTFEMARLEGSFPNGTGTTPNYHPGDFVITDQKPWLVEFTASGSVTVEGDCGNSACSYTTGLQRQGEGAFQAKTDISQFVVTVEDGTRYVFASPTLSSLDVPYHPMMHYLERQIYVSTWRLVAILGSNYPDYGPDVPTGLESGSWIRLSYGAVRTGTKEANSPSFIPQIAQTQYLSTINTPTHHAIFTTVDRQEPNLPHHARSIQQRLTTIQATETVSLSNVALSPCTAQCRTGLESIAFAAADGAFRPGYTFGYGLNPAIGPQDFFLLTDDFGYYTTTSNEPQSHSDQGGHAWSLTSIVHPTGATDIINYETDHVASDSLTFYNLGGWTDTYGVPPNRRWMGGPRVASMVRSNGMGEEAETVYNYGPGRLTGIPPLVWQRMSDPTASGTRLVSRSNRGSSRVVYEWIEAIEPDYSQTRRYFSTDTQFPGGAVEVYPVRAVFDRKSRACEFIVEEPTALCEDLYVLQDNGHWNWGRHFKTERVGPTGTRSEEMYRADYVKLNLVDVWSSWGEPDHVGIKYGVSQLISVQVEQDNLRTFKNYVYDQSTNLQKEVWESNGSGWRVRETTYAHSHYPEMKDLNMLSQVAREDVYEFIGGSPIKHHASEVTTWARPVERPWAPARTFRWLAPEPSTVKPSFSQWTGGTPAGWIETSRYDYGAHGNVITRWDSRGTRTSYAWGQGLGRITGVTVHGGAGTGPEDVHLTLGYDVRWLKVNQICQASQGTCTSAVGTTSWFDYDTFGRLVSVRNNSGDTLTIYGYAFSRTHNGSLFDASSPNTTSITRFLENGASPKTSLTRTFADGLGRPIQTQTRLGSDHIVTAIDYDEMGRTVRNWKPYLDASTAGLYTSQHATQATAWYRSYLSLGFDPKPFGETVYQQDGSSRILASIAEYTQHADSVLFHYGKEVVSGQELRYQEKRDEDGRRVRQYFDLLGRMVRSVHGYGTASAATTVFQYDILDNLTAVTQPEGQVWTYAYNTAGQLTQKTTPDIGTVRYKYDRGGLLRFTREANGRVVFTTYDFAGRPLVSGVTSLSIAAFDSLDPDTPAGFETTTSTWRTAWHYNSSPPDTLFPWNTLGTRANGLPADRVTGRLAARAYRSGGQWQVELYSYDGEGRVATKSVLTQDMSARDSRYDYTYDLQSRLTERIVQTGPIAFRHWYEYDEIDRLAKIFASSSSGKPGTPDVEYTYHVSGQPSGIRYQGQSQPLPHRYTIRDWLDEIGTPGTTMWDWWYSPLPFHARNRYTPAGNIDTLEIYQRHSPHIHKGYRYRLAYDDLGRLASAFYDGQSSGGFGTSAAYRVDNISYDRNGNILSLRRRDNSGAIVEDLVYTYGSTNRLGYLTNNAAQPHLNVGTTIFNHSANGNVTFLEDMTRNRYDWFSYDERNQVTDYEELYYGSWMRYRYNAEGHRYLKHDMNEQVVEYYTMDGSIALGYTHPNGATDWNVLTPWGEVVGRQPYNNNRFYYIKDHLGSVRTVVNNTGTVVETRDFYPFGLHMPGRNMMSTSPAKENFTGKERDAETGLDYFGARYYFPAIGRWLTPDPLKDLYHGHSPYNYVLNNPLRLADPDGRCVLEMVDPRSGECISMSEAGLAIDTAKVAAGVGVVAGGIALRGGGGLALKGTAATAGATVVIGGIVFYLSAQQAARLGADLGAAIARLERRIAGPDALAYSLRVVNSGWYRDVRGRMMYLEAGDVWKYGETTAGNIGGRYSENKLKSLIPGGVYPNIEAYGTQVEMKMMEQYLIYGYLYRHLSLPPGNRIRR
jgi:RHS repeat-associated protein